MTIQPSSILIVDDTLNNIKVLFDLLQAEGFRVLIAHSGEKALQQIQEAKPDLILLDVMMPGIDGFETCTRIKANPETLDIPIIFMTALSDPVDRVKGLKLGAVDYITKPFQQEEVLARVTIHLKLYHLAAELRVTNNALEQHVADRTTELATTLQQLQTAQLQTVQQEKMSTLGNLVAGVAHEINNPLSCLSGNLPAAEDYIQDLFRAIALYQEECPQPSDATQKALQKLDLDFIQTDLAQLIQTLQESIDRMMDISTSLRTFSRADSAHPIPFDLHEGINSTLVILKHRLKAAGGLPEIQILKDYGNLPWVNCFAGQLNQVLMNLLANAIDALRETNSTNPTIHIRTEASDQVNISIHDNGAGIPPEVQAKIFDSMFTTKPVGQGTGLGLAIAQQIIQDKHGGSLTVHSQPGQGTTFTISLPLQ
jgi:signal transduction histidine kinase